MSRTATYDKFATIFAVECVQPVVACEAIWGRKYTSSEEQNIPTHSQVERLSAGDTQTANPAAFPCY